MIRIPCKQREKMTFHDYDILMSVNVYRKKLKDGESVNSIMLNARILFWGGVFVVFVLLFIYIIGDDPIRGWAAVLCCVIGVFGILYMICGLVVTVRMKRLFLQALQATEKAMWADIIFDETGVHAWENPEKGFDKTWEQFMDCFISSEYILICFQTADCTLTLRNKDNMEAQVLEALALGNRTDIVTRFEIDGRELKGLSNSGATQTGR